MRRFFSIIILSGIALFLVACGNNDENQHVSGEPDVVSSIKMNQDERLVVVANRDEIEDKIEFAKLLVKMCQENSFKTIKFSTDHGYATSLDMSVYLWKDEIEGNNPIMTVEFKPVEWSQGYDIVNHADKFLLLIDGILIE